MLWEEARSRIDIIVSAVQSHPLPSSTHAHLNRASFILDDIVEKAINGPIIFQYILFPEDTRMSWDFQYHIAIPGSSYFLDDI